MKDSTKKRIGELICDAIDDGTTMGANILIRKNGEELFYGEYGMADREKQQPIRRDTIFRLYSMSKPVTAAAVIILVEQGKLDLAQHVEEFLPGFADQTVDKNGKICPVTRKMNILQLLNMTSGLTYGDEETLNGKLTTDLLSESVAKLHTDQEMSTIELMNRLGQIPLAFEPDSSWRYGLSADVLGAVIEVASGMRFGDFMKKYIFEPLQMKDTDFWVPDEKKERLVTTYVTTGKGTMEVYDGDHLDIDNKMEKRPAFESGGAGLVSTVDDYARFAQMLLNKGELDGVRIMSEEMAEFLTSGDLTAPQQQALRAWEGLEGFTYSHLMRQMRNTGMAVTLASDGEYGWDGWLGCYFANLPKEDMTILLMMQKKDAGTITLTRKLRNVILSDKER